jgi:hypothetical protein
MPPCLLFITLEGIWRPPLLYKNLQMTREFGHFGYKQPIESFVAWNKKTKAQTQVTWSFLCLVSATLNNIPMLRPDYALTTQKITWISSNTLYRRIKAWISLCVPRVFQNRCQDGYPSSQIGVLSPKALETPLPSFPDLLAQLLIAYLWRILDILLLVFNGHSSPPLTTLNRTSLYIVMVPLFVPGVSSWTRWRSLDGIELSKQH